jgi:disulfide bond formation protein DsbB
MVCIACHGPGGVGVEGLGKPFTTSEFVRSQTDAELLAFVKVGRPIGHPDNTTGVDMPPKGGNPALTDEDLLDIIAYIRTLQE